MDQLSTGPLRSTNRISFWTFITLSFIIITGRFIIPRWGVNTPVDIALVNLLCTILGIGFLRIVLLHFFSDRLTAVILVLVVGGTNLFCLATHEQDLIHPFLFLCYVLVLWSTIQWQKTFRWEYAVFLGFITAFTISVRLSEISCILIPVFWGIYNKNSFHDQWRSVKQHSRQAITIVFFILLAVLSQIFTPELFSGIKDMTGNPQHNHFTFIGPYLPQVLFSFRKGWLIYTPVMIFSIIGFYFLAGKNPFLFYSAFLFFLINLYIVSSWSLWWEGESFGQRSLISAYPVMALPLGYFLDWLLRKKGYIKIPLFIIIGFFLLLNLFQTGQYAHGILDSSRMTYKYYHAVFGAVRPVKEAEKYLLKEYPYIYKETLQNEHLYDRKILAHYDFEKPDPSNPTRYINGLSRSGKFSFTMNKKNQFSPGINEKFSKLTSKDYSWIRATGYVYYITDDAFKDAYLVITCNHADKAYKYKALALEKEELVAGEWNEVTMDWQTPYLIDKDDLLQAYFWYPGKKSIYVDDIQIEIFDPRE